MCVGRRWEKGDKKFDDTARLVARRACAAEARLVRDHVFTISLIKQDKTLESGNAAIKLQKRIHKLRRFVCQLHFAAVLAAHTVSSICRRIALAHSCLQHR